MGVTVGMLQLRNKLLRKSLEACVLLEILIEISSVVLRLSDLMADIPMDMLREQL